MIYEGLILIEQNLKAIIESNLARTGLLYRMYSRIKEKSSIEEKIIRKGYKENGKLVQDLIGLRVMTYFNEDIEVLSNLVSYHLVMNITFDNLAFLCNYLFFKNEELTALTPPHLVGHFDEVFEVESN